MGAVSILSWIWRLLRRFPPHLKLVIVVALLLAANAFLSTAVVLVLAGFGRRLRARNESRRRWALSQLSLFERDDEKRRLVAGFFHPYW